MRLRDTVVRQRGVAVDGPYAGAATELDWTNPGLLTLSCSIQEQASTEQHTDRETVVARWDGYFYTDADLTNADRLAWKGLTLTVDGEVFINVRGGTASGRDHKHCTLKLVS